VVKSSGSGEIWGFDIDEHPRNAKRRSASSPGDIVRSLLHPARGTGDPGPGLYGVPKSERITDALLAAVHLTDKAHAYAAPCRAE
jgi:ABC-2 type transport system ATP-binding protein